MAITFGIAEFENAVAGVHLQSVTIGESCSTSEAIGEDGNIEQIDVYAKKKTIQCEGNVVSGGDVSALTVGGTLTVSGTAYKLDNVSFKSGVNGVKTASISGSAPMSSGD